MSKQDPVVPATHYDDAESTTQFSNSPSLLTLMNARLTRRQTLFGGFSAATTVLLGGLGVSGCSDSNNDDDDAATPPPAPPRAALGFTAVPKSLADAVTIPAGYSMKVLYATGDPISDAAAAWAGDGSETGASYALRAGDHHDGMHFFGLSATGTPDRASSTRGILCVNHENISGTQIFLHPNGPTTTAGVRPEDEVRKEMNCHGVGVFEIAKDATGTFAINKASTFNRRVTPFTPIDLGGPVRGSRFAVTKYSTGATRTRGILNQCGNGYTPWGTYLTTEENWAGYFKRVTGDDAVRNANENRALARVGIPPNRPGNYNWTSVAGDDFQRLDISVKGTSDNGSDDYRNEANTYGYIVEIDPYNASSAPVKRTAMGRFGHETAWPAIPVEGRPVVFYMGDDSQNEYLYKFVSKANYAAADTGLAAGAKYLDEGTLYVSKFDASGSGAWVALVQGSNGLNADNALYPFTSQAAVCVHARLAADSVGATKMDRPEWTAVNPQNGEVYLTLTNNSSRGGASPVDAANPRAYANAAGAAGGNVNGHVIRLREDSDDPTATTFTWDVYLFGARATADANNVNLSGLDDSNDLSSPDGLWFSRPTNAAAGVLWIQTDDGAYTDTTNCMMLAAVPGRVGDGATKSVTSTVAGAPVTVTTRVGAAPGTSLRRFLVGPKGCEITGIDSTPDGKALFVNIQHPGEGTAAADIANPANYQSHFPGGGTSRPRSATLVITRDDGGVVGIT